MKKKLNLGIFGFGCVGSGLYHVLRETEGIKAEIRKICIKHPGKSRELPAHYFTTDHDEILNDPEIDIVVELIDDSVAAFDILKKALKNGKGVVTANKKMLAEHLEEIYQLQQQYKLPVLYEGAACASIPVIRNLEEYYDNDLITKVEGIFNGSTNYILTKVFEERKDYHEALRQAQELGFAESDPTLDVKAFDPKFKLAIIITHAFGVFVQPEDIINFGIDRLTPLDLRYARENGYTIKLIATAFKSEGKVYGLVAPQFVEVTHMLSSVRNEYNAVIVEGAFSEKQLFVGKGAGSYPTGSAVLSDISALTYQYAYEYKKLNQQSALTFTNDALIEVQVTFKGQEVKSGDFEKFTGGYLSNGTQFLTGWVKLEKIREWANTEGVSVVRVANSNLQTGVQREAKRMAVA
ncbi:MAG: homoserine dehydrogenase [Cyclobacteriaceae bacterium]